MAPKPKMFTNKKMKKPLLHNADAFKCKDKNTKLVNQYICIYIYIIYIYIYITYILYIYIYITYILYIYIYIYRQTLQKNNV